eukprot:GHVT01080250.1.p1 GENE.GHVT01080250.1~~GHVT01080250.1.p1  ORF type:complete len:165 (+),score=25.26 GHVT01080250.1:336-830(+)
MSRLLSACRIFSSSLCRSRAPAGRLLPCSFPVGGLHSGGGRFGSPMFRRSIVTSVSNAEEYDSLVSAAGAASSPPLVVVQYSASWCGPCRQISPQVAKLSDELDDVKFVYVDIDMPHVQALVEKYDIESVPTFVLLRNGHRLKKLQGARLETLQDAIQEHRSSQ